MTVSPVVWSGFERGRLRVKQGTPRPQGKATMVRQGTVALKMVVPVISKGAEEKAMLEEDLRRMGCHGLIL